MTRATVLQEVRQMRFAELYARRQRRALTMAEAAEMLGVTERTFRRWSTRYEAEGMEGLEDRRLGRASARAVPVDEALQMVTLYETCYTGWTETLPRALAGRAWRAAVLPLDQDPAADRRTRGPCASTRGASEEAAPQGV